MKVFKGISLKLKLIVNVLRNRPIIANCTFYSPISIKPITGLIVSNNTFDGSVPKAEVNFGLDLVGLKRNELCFCDNVEFGSYAHTVTMKYPFPLKNCLGELIKPGKLVAIDVCIATEIAELWHKGVHTLNSCCGHQKANSGVIIEEKDYQLMADLGYTDWSMLANGCREFLLKTGTHINQTKEGNDL